MTKQTFIHAYDALPAHLRELTYDDLDSWFHGSDLGGALLLTGSSKTVNSVENRECLLVINPSEVFNASRHRCAQLAKFTNAKLFGRVAATKNRTHIKARYIGSFDLRMTAMHSQTVPRVIRAPNFDNTIVESHDIQTVALLAADNIKALQVWAGWPAKCMHLSRLFISVTGDEFGQCASLSSQRRIYAVSYSWRQNVWPLPNGLNCDADSLGCGGCGVA